MKVDVYKIDGTKTKAKQELSDDIFGIEPNDHVIYLAVKSYLANQRQGTHKTKERNEVRGGGRKPWRQKGRGVARAGTIRSPLWKGGGRIFGPLPHDYNMKLSKNTKRLAKISAFTYKARQEEIMIVEDFTLENPKTREMFVILKNMNVDSKKVLLVTSELDKNIVIAGRNIPNLTVRVAKELSTYDILNCQIMLLQKSSLDKIKEVVES